MLRPRHLCLLVAYVLVALATSGWFGPASKTATAQGSGSLVAPPIQLPPGVPAKVGDVLRYVEENGQAPPGFVGGRIYTNDGRSGEEVLPRLDADGDPIEYREWDVNRRVPGKNRGAERLITGSDGSAYFTSDHYQTFAAIRGFDAPARAASVSSTRASDLSPIVQLPPDAASKVNAVLAYFRVHGAAMPGYEGGREFQNRGGPGSQALPKLDADFHAIRYQEWDVNPKIPGQNRGTQRLITGSDGTAYYTADHYRTFARVR